MTLEQDERVEAGQQERNQDQPPQRMNRVQQWLTHVSNQRTSLALAVFLFFVHLGLVIQRIYQYRQSSLAVIIARASGQCLNFDCFLVLLMTLRRSITWLRTAGFDAILPLDRHIYFHKLIGWIICFFSFVHSVAHMANIGFLSIEKGVLMTDYLATGGWLPGTVTPSGLALFLIIVIMGTFSHRIVRRSGRFEVFYWTHLLCIPFFGLLMLHGINAWMWMVTPLILFMLELICRFGFICSGRGRTHITSMNTLPNQVVRLRIRRPDDFEFKCGDYIYVNIPDVARFEWHPFTISSAPEDQDYLTLHIRVVGGWTRRVYAICQENFEKLQPYQSDQRILNQISSKLELIGKKADDSFKFQSLRWQMKAEDNLAFQAESCTVEISRISHDVTRQVLQLSPIEIPISMNGPYSGSTTRAWNYQQALFIAGGIGVTPFASLLQSVMKRYRNAMSTCPHCSHMSCSNLPASMGKLKHVDFMWINRDLLSFKWFLELLLEMDREKRIAGSVMDKFLDIQLYQTGNRTLPTDLCTHCTNPSNAPTNDSPNNPTSSGCSCTIRRMKHLLRFGRPVWDEVFSEIASRSVGKLMVFYCGPAPMARVIKKKCKQFGFGFTKEIS